MKRILLAVLTVILVAGPTGAGAGPMAKLEEAMCQRLYRGVDRLARGLAARASRARDVELAVRRCEMDQRHRVYLDLDGDLDLSFPALPERARGWLNGLEGEHIVTDGSIVIDYTVTELEFPAPKLCHLAFSARVILVLENMMTAMLETAITVTETVTVVGLSGDLAALVETVNPLAAGDGLDAGVHDLGKVLLGLAGVEAYEHYRALDQDRAALGGRTRTAALIARHLVRAVVEACVHVTSKIAGAGFGTAVGAALLPAHGAVLGAIAGAAFFGMLGKAVFEHVTVNWGVRLAMKRIARIIDRRSSATDPEDIEHLDEKQDELEGSFLHHVVYQMTTDRFTHLDEFIEQVHGLSPADKVKLASLKTKVEEKLRYEVMAHKDELFARKLAQLVAAFH